jgi:hypothetical protein
MSFSSKQLRALKRTPDHRHIRTRETRGRTLTYLEGWFAISEANRIFGFDGWSRETVDSRCILARENRGSFVAIYTAKVRVTVHADGLTLIREGHGASETRGDSLGEVHDIALKAAETDATKRALATFGRPFGLELYRSAKANERRQPAAVQGQAPTERTGFHPDDLTPVPRPSYFRGRGPNEIAQHFRQERDAAAKMPSAPQKIESIADEAPALVPEESAKIDKSQLTIGEPKRLRDKAHLRHVASKPCLICGRQPSDPHHLRFAQPRALGMKVSDEFTVPLCRTHHRQLHQVGDERTWWKQHNIEPLTIAKTLWAETRPSHACVPSNAGT